MKESCVFWWHTNYLFDGLGIQNSYKPDGGIDVELTSLTFFCAITFRDTAVSAEFCKITIEKIIYILDKN